METGGKWTCVCVCVRVRVRVRVRVCVWGGGQGWLGGGGKREREREKVKTLGLECVKVLTVNVCMRLCALTALTSVSWTPNNPSPPDLSTLLTC